MSKPFCESGSAADTGSATKRPYLIALTGTRGCGKSALGDILERSGFPVIDTDDITHELLNGPCAAYTEVLARFGEDLAPAAGGPIDRSILAQRAFQSDATKAELEAIMFPRISERLDEKIAALAAEKIVFVQVPLLHEAGLKPYFDESWCLTAEESILISRIMKRDEVSEDQARHLLSLQLPQSEKARLSDYSLDNSGTLDELALKAAPLLRGALGRAEAKATRDRGTSTESDDEANARYRGVLKHLGELGLDAVLGKMGEVARTQHKEAQATVSMDVSSAEGDSGADSSRELKVQVIASVRNKPGTPGSPTGCSCGCGTTCRVSCACAPDCGCGCKKPSPPPPPPPCGDEDKKCKSGRQWLWPAVIALIALLAFLAFLFAWTHQRQNIVIINQPPVCEGPCKPTEPPVIPPVDPGPFNPPAPPPVVEKPATETMNEAPGYAFRFLHNAVRVRVAKWEVGCYEGCKGATVIGYDTDGRRLVYQEYDADYWMTFQWVYTYFADGTVQVDRFEGRSNTFTGRSLYRYSQTGVLMRVEHQNGLRRLVLTATFVRNGSGTPVALNVEEFDPVSGQSLVKRVIEGPDSTITYLKLHFYEYGWVTR